MKYKNIIFSAFILIWAIAHYPGVMYGTKDIPLHISYIGDEQSPINGALHILKDKSLLGLRNETNLYYGPVFSVVALPAVIADFSIKYIKGEIHNAEDYKDNIIWNWGGIVINARIISVIFSLLILWIICRLFNTNTLNPEKKWWIPYFAVLLVSTNYYFFEYSHFFKHWIYLLFVLISQLYLLVLITEGSHKKRNWIIYATVTIFGFGISYFSLIFTSMWLPFFVIWMRNKEWKKIYPLLITALLIAIGGALVIWWHPYAFFRIWQGNAFVGYGFSKEISSFSYYATLIIKNHLLLILTSLGLLVFLIKKDKIYKSPILWSIILPGLLNFLMFVKEVRYEGRYMLPTIFCLLLVSIYLISLSNIKKTIRVSVIFLISLTIIFHTIHIAKWIQIYSKNPIEYPVIAYIKKEGENKKTLLVNAYILGYPHTIEAYKDYMKNTKKEDVNLYKEILVTPLPKDIKPINVFYATNEVFKNDKNIFNKYDHIYVKEDARQDINQFDYFDEDITRLWHYWLDSYKYNLVK